MCDTGNFLVSSGEEIYTLAQSGTQYGYEKPAGILVSGEGTSLINNPSLASRAKRKVISRAMLLNLIDVAKSKGDYERVQSYWNAYHCLTNVVTSDNVMYGKYCKNRFCTVCSAIRKAEMINKYYPVLSQWEEPYFVTLTVLTCKAHSLEKRIRQVLRAFELILNRCKKRYQRGKGIKVYGIRSLECNFNPIRRWYNPHFHIIVPNREVAELLRNEWIKQWKPIKKTTPRYKYVDPEAQDIRPVKNLERDLIETIKYGSKIFTEHDVRKKVRSKIPHKIYINALDNIFAAMKGKRIFERFGFNLPKQPVTSTNNKRVFDYEEWLFPADATDWVNPETGECLSGYLQSAELSHLLNECIDKELY